MRLLLVEDDRMIGESLQKALRQGGYAVDWARTAGEADLSLLDNDYNLVILDLGLPDKPGLALLKNLRGKDNGIPVLILTARDTVSDRVLGLDSGADDYMLKPFALEELEARIRLLLRRKSGSSSPVLKHGDITLNPATHEVTYKDRKSVLPGREYALMFALMETPGKILSRAQLEEKLYGWNEEVGSNAVEVHIHQIRKKLGADIIRNVRNTGYMIAGSS
jgi:two-component system, OmpR family, response regulator QseB